MTSRYSKLVVIATLAVAGCTNGGAGSGGSPTPTAAGATAVWREFVTCARANGQPDMPDAVVDNAGAATFGAFDQKTAIEAVRQPCGAILDRLPAGANPLARPSMTAQELETIRRYIQCLRENGMPDEPDAGPNGEINDPPKYREPPLLDAYNHARGACDPILQGR